MKFSQFDNLIGESPEAAREYLEQCNIDAVFAETKDRYNQYEIKRVISVKQTKGNSLEIIFSGFPPSKE
ncbi:MAG: hypothetical protein JXN65_10725 [Clostridia bacterium]|nr:hypothetical protein [Clostridia bacterium]